MKNYSRLVIAFAVCLVAASPSLAGGGHDKGMVSSVDALSPFACAPEDCTVIGTSTLYRSADGVGANIDLMDLTPNTPFTVWAVVFNNPNRCAAFPHGACGLGDLSNPAVKAAIFWATGNYSDGDGNAHFQTFITKGNNNRIQLIAGELTNPSKAEIHFIFREHEIVFGEEYGAINTPAGSCPSSPPGGPPCKDIGSATHER